MPMKRELYPDNWEAIARAVKEKTNWICEECGKPCRRPGEDWFEFEERLEKEHPQWTGEFYDEVYDDETGEWGYVERKQRFTLTVAHLNHIPQDCHPNNLKALCSVCHLRYDAHHHAKNASRTRYQKLENQGQLSLF